MYNVNGYFWGYWMCHYNFQVLDPHHYCLTVGYRLLQVCVYLKHDIVYILDVVGAIVKRTVLARFDFDCLR
jgi:hypothetical protein